jgi:hypothetical protein
MTDREREAVYLRESGWKLTRIAARMKISKQRVHQLLNADEFIHKKRERRIRKRRLAKRSSVG